MEPYLARWTKFWLTCKDRWLVDEDMDQVGDANVHFGFYAEDQDFVERVAVTVRRLLRRPDITGVQITQIGRFLIGLERLPRVTPGFGLDVSLHNNQNENWSYQSIHLDEETFCLETGETVSDPAIGSDHTSWKAFEVTVYGERSEPDVSSLDAWFEGFAMRMENPEMRLEIDSSGDALDLECEADLPHGHLWEDLPSEYP